MPATEADGQADAEDAGDQAALGGGHLVGEDRDLGGEQRVEEHLGDAPADEHDRDVRRQGDVEDADVPPTSPTSIHGRRMPRRDVVRSLNRPKSGLLTIASSEPTPVTSARFFGASSMPTRSLTFSASDTSSGPRKSREPPA